MTFRNFSIRDWETRAPKANATMRTLVGDIPPPPDTYEPGPFRYLSSPPAEIIQRRERMEQRRQRNYAYFIDHVLPLIADHLTPFDWQDVAAVVGPDRKHEMYTRGGWAETAFGYWTHPVATPEAHLLCEAIRNKQPLPASAFPYPVVIPSGYTRRGDLYVYADNQASPASDSVPAQHTTTKRLETANEGA